MALDKLQIALELDKRGKLPENKKSILKELQNRNYKIPLPGTKDSINKFDVTKQEKQFSPSQTFAGNLGNTLSLGLAPIAYSGVNALLNNPSSVTQDEPNIDAIRNIINPLISPSLNRGFQQSYSNFKQDLETANQQNPNSAIGGTLAGFISPGSLASGAFNAVSKGVQAKLPNLLGQILGPAAASITTGQALSTKPMNDLPGRANQAVVEGVLGGAFGGLTAGGKKLVEGIKTGIVQNARKGFLEYFPVVGGLFKGPQQMKAAQQKAAHEIEKTTIKDLVKLIPDNLSGKSRLPAGEFFQKTVDTIDNSLTKSLTDATKPALNKFGKSTVDPKTITGEIDKILSNLGTDVKTVVKTTLGPGGEQIKNTKIIPSSLKNIVDPETKTFATRLLKFKNILSKPTSLRELDLIRKQMQSLANFEKLERTQTDKLFGGLSRKVKELYFETLEKVADPQTKEIVSSARKVFADNQGIMKVLKKISNKPPEKIVDSARTYFPGSFINEVVEKQPGLKKSIGDIILNDIARSSKTPTTFTNVLDKYGRESLSKLYGQQKFNQILNLEKRMVDAFSKGIKVEITPFWQKTIDAIEKGQLKSEKTIQGLITYLSNQVE